MRQQVQKFIIVDVAVAHPGTQHPPAAHEAHVQDPSGEVGPAGLQVAAARLVEAGMGVEGRLVHQRIEPQVHVAQPATASKPEQPLHEGFGLAVARSRLQQQEGPRRLQQRLLEGTLTPSQRAAGCRAAQQPHINGHAHRPSTSLRRHVPAGIGVIPEQRAGPGAQRHRHSGFRRYSVAHLCAAPGPKSPQSFHGHPLLAWGSLCNPGWSATAQIWLTVASTSWTQAILHLSLPIRVSLCGPGWSAGARSWPTAALTSWAQSILLPQPLQQQRPQAHTTTPESGFHNVAQDGLKLLDSSDPPTLASEKAGFLHVGQAGLELLTSSDQAHFSLPKCGDYRSGGEEGQSLKARGGQAKLVTAKVRRRDHKR
ncbi:hypothetical protein AAY473_009901 [Plecturocebus cupreus]